MKIEFFDADVFYQRIDDAFEEAAQDVVNEARATAPRRTGAYADGHRASEPVHHGIDRLTASVGSDVVYGPVMERSSRTVRKAAARFPEHMTRRLQEQAAKRPLPGGRRVTDTFDPR